MDIGVLFALLFSGMIVNNVVLSQFLGMCPFLGVSKKTSNALGMGFAVMVVMVLSSIITWLIYTFLFVPFNLEFLNTIAFIIVIASIVQVVEMTLRKFSQPLYKALGVYLPLITTNCAILGVALLNIQNEFNLPETIFYALGSSLGFLLVLVLFSAIRERLELLPVPKAFKGLPVALLAASMMSVGFMGLAGIL